jgi:hypothetical protein
MAVENPLVKIHSLFAALSKPKWSLIKGLRHLVPFLWIPPMFGGMRALYPGVLLKGTILRSSYMTRGVARNGLALMLALVLAAGSCLACSEMVPKSHCCQKHTSCNGYNPAPLEAHCANPKVDLGSAEMSTIVSVGVPLAAHLGPPVYVLCSRDFFPPSPPIVSSSPPDLYLLHSSLTI